MQNGKILHKELVLGKSARLDLFRKLYVPTQHYGYVLMNQSWSDTDLNKHWLLDKSDFTLLKGRSVSNRIAVAIQLKHYQFKACFVDDVRSIGDVVLEFVAAQIECTPLAFEDYDCHGRTGRQHRKEILAYLDVKPFDDNDELKLKKWLKGEILQNAPNRAHLKELITDWFLRCQVERPGQYRLRRIIRSAESEFEEQLFSLLNSRLNDSTKEKLDELVAEQREESLFAYLCSDTGPVSLDSVMQAIDKIQLLSSLEIPKDALHDISPKLISRYRARAATEDAWEICRHPDNIRYALLVFYCIPREGALIDSLVELLIQIIHRISARAEKKVVKELVSEVTKVHSKNALLYRIAEAVQKEPDGSVRDVIFPVADKQTIDQLVKEYRSSGAAYTNHIYTKIRSSYAHHYRKMLPSILSALGFRSNNIAWRPILDAIDVIKESKDRREQYFSLDEVPTDGLVQNKWSEIVIEIAPDGSSRINRINYEICVLQALREKLRCKEVWVVGADHFCNPEQDMPEDFEANRNNYYAALDKPLDPQAFIEQMKSTLNNTLGKFNAHLPKDIKGTRHSISLPSRALG